MAEQEVQVALLKQSMEFQQKEISEVKDSIREIKKILSDFIDSAPDKFATKEEHRKNSEKIEALEKVERSVMKESLKTIISIFV